MESSTLICPPYHRSKEALLFSLTFLLTKFPESLVIIHANNIDSSPQRILPSPFAVGERERSNPLALGVSLPGYLRNPPGPCVWSFGSAWVF